MSIECLLIERAHILKSGMCNFSCLTINTFIDSVALNYIDMGIMIVTGIHS